MAETLGKYLRNREEFARVLLRMISQILVIHAVARSRMLDHLETAPLTIDQLSEACGMKADMLARVVNYLAAEEVVELDDEGRIHRTAVFETLRQLYPNIVWSCTSLPAGLDLDRALVSGSVPWDAHFGKPVFESIRDDPAIMEAFIGAMTNTTWKDHDAIFLLHDFKPFDLAVDIGGSQGVLLMELLDRFPSSRGILFELPETAEIASQHFAQCRNGHRMKAVGGDFFKDVPKGGDLYLLKQILHDWSDEECRVILRNVRGAIDPSGRVAVLDRLLSERPEAGDAAESDIFMLLFTTGQERKLSELNRLFEECGFRFDRVTRNPAGVSVIEAVPV